MPRAVAQINLASIRTNLARVRELVGDRSVWGMVKANAYGHGLLSVAQALAGIEHLGVASLDEALTLKRAGITAPIVVMSGFYEADELPNYITNQIGAVIHDPQQLSLMSKTRLDAPLNIWIKLDTGMHRLGFSCAQLPLALSQLKSYPQVNILGVMTHLADADNYDRRFTLQQLDQFYLSTSDLNFNKSVGNSAAIFAYTDLLGDTVRPGIMLYGLSPFVDRIGKEFGLKPAMTLSAPLIAIKDCQPGDAIGYGCTYRCETPMRVGIVAIGYGDGYPRHAKTGTPTCFGNYICPLLGRVSMDMIAIDISAAKSIKVGDRIELWGNRLPAERVARHCGTIAYELVTNLTSRIERVFD